MINEKDFISNLKRYDNTNLEFDSIDEINEVTGGNILPLRKRGIADNEFTVINLGGFEIINDDTVLNLFNVIPPGPKEMTRHRTHLVVGRYSQAITPIILVKQDNDFHVLVQKRNPVNLGGELSTEIFRDYIKQKSDFTEYFESNFKDLITHSISTDTTKYSYYWENIGIIGVNTCVYISEIEIGTDVKIRDIEAALNSGDLAEPANIIGSRELKFLLVDKIMDRFEHMVESPISTVGKYNLNDLFSVNAIFCLLRYFEKKGYTLERKKIKSIVG